MTEVDNWRELGQQIRVDSIRAANTTKSGHPTSSMSAADLMAVLCRGTSTTTSTTPRTPTTTT